MFVENCINKFKFYRRGSGALLSGPFVIPWNRGVFWSKVSIQHRFQFHGRTKIPTENLVSTIVEEKETSYFCLILFHFWLNFYSPSKL